MAQDNPQMQYYCDGINEILENPSSGNDTTLLENIKALRNFCAKGPDVQCYLANNEKFLSLLSLILCDNVKGKTLNPALKCMTWQLLANITVNNIATQKIIWDRFSDIILKNCQEKPIYKHTNVQLMLIYNAFQKELITEQKVLETVTKLWQLMFEEKCEENLEFLDFLYEDFLVKRGRDAVRCYARLDLEDRIAFLDYLAHYLRHDSPNGLVHSFLLQYISSEFKKKSDVILQQLTRKVDELYPKEVYSLLRVIACATGCEKYENIFSKDHSLFLNVGNLLRCLVEVGKVSDKNMFSPMNKLEEVAPSSKEIPCHFESEISYELKTLLVRCLANLLYKNKINHGYCIDTNLMPSLLECTNIDARNPLIKEWSILAIRNACIDCPEIQEIIKGLTKQGVVKNDVLEELNLDMGALRIRPNKE